MSTTHFELLDRPDKRALLEEFKGKRLDGVRTPAMVIDKAKFAQNCSRMHEKATQWGASFRAHVKTHKTAEGTRLQLVSHANKTNAVVVSTVMEAWGIVKAGLVEEGVVKDILYGLPIAQNKIEDLSTLRAVLDDKGAILRLMVDHPDQIRFLQDFEKQRPSIRRWSVFIKIDGGQKRAGVVAGSDVFNELIKEAFESPSTSVFGFYIHAGNAYSSKSLAEATNFLTSEVVAVNSAAKLAKERFETGDLILSVGSTPTAHAANSETRQQLSEFLHGSLELHAGNYPMLDLQQLSTRMIDRERISQHVRATVVSFYVGRGKDGTDEACIDAGAIAFSKDTGPSGTFGEVIGTKWVVGRISQEHGTLTRAGKGEALPIGKQLKIISQHACLTAAAYPWYYVVDSSGDTEEIVDVWVPWKGW